MRAGGARSQWGVSRACAMLTPPPPMAWQFVVDHPDGRSIVVRSKPGEAIAADAIKAVSGAGMPIHKRPFQHGRLFVHFTVDFPKLTDEQRTALRAILPAPERAPMAEDTEEAVLEDVDTSTFGRTSGSAAAAVRDTHAALHCTASCAVLTALVMRRPTTPMMRREDTAASRASSSEACVCRVPCAAAPLVVERRGTCEALLALNHSATPTPSRRNACCASAVFVSKRAMAHAQLWPLTSSALPGITSPVRKYSCRACAASCCAPATPAAAHSASAAATRTSSLAASSSCCSAPTSCCAASAMGALSTRPHRRATHGARTWVQARHVLQQARERAAERQHHVAAAAACVSEQRHLREPTAGLRAYLACSLAALTNSHTPALRAPSTAGRHARELLAPAPPRPRHGPASSRASTGNAAAACSARSAQ